MMNHRRLDALFAEKVLGCNLIHHQQRYACGNRTELWEHIRCGCKEDNRFTYAHSCNDEVGSDQYRVQREDGVVLEEYEIEYYTTNLQAAWEGVEKLRSAPRLAYFELMVGYDDPSHYEAAWRPNKRDYPELDRCFVIERTPALAVVKVCLLAAGVDPDEVEAETSKSAP